MSTSNNVKQESSWHSDMSQGLFFLLLGAVFIVGLGTKVAMMSAAGAEFSGITSSAGQMLINALASTEGTIGDLFLLVVLFSLAYFTTSTGIFKFILAGSKRGALAFQQLERAGMEDLSTVLHAPMQEVGVEA